MGRRSTADVHVAGNFAVNDQTTARYFAEKLGDHIAWRKVRTQQGYEWMPHGATLLRTGPEFARESSKDSEKAVILFEGGDAALVRRAGYDRLFGKDQYDPNPYQPKPGLNSLAGIQAAARDFWEEGFGRLLQSRYGPRVMALLGDKFSAEAMLEAMAIYNARTEAEQCAAFQRAADALNRAVGDGKAADVQFWRRVFAEYVELVEGKGAGSESERRNAQAARNFTKSALPPYAKASEDRPDSPPRSPRRRNRT
jgi:hypothetical protein